jgi:hypothetical protein
VDPGTAESQTDLALEDLSLEVNNNSAWETIRENIKILVKDTIKKNTETLIDSIK